MSRICTAPLKFGLAAIAVAFSGAQFATGATAAEPSDGAVKTEEPIQTTATYGNWTVRCRAAKSAGAGKLCEMVQAITPAKSPGAIANIALGQPGADAVVRMVIQLPIAISLSEPVSIAVNDKTVATLAYQTCYPNFCVAQAQVPNEAIGRFKAANTMTLSFSDRTRRTINVKASLKGFTAAYQQLAKAE